MKQKEHEAMKLWNKKLQTAMPAGTVRSPHKKKKKNHIFAFSRFHSFTFLRLHILTFEFRYRIAATFDNTIGKNMASFEAPMLHHQPFDDGSIVTAEQAAQNQIEFNSAQVKYMYFVS